MQFKMLVVFWSIFVEDTNIIYRSSRPEMFYKKGVLRNFTKFPGKHLCRSLFLNKVAGLTPGTLLKKDSGTGVFLGIL